MKWCSLEKVSSTTKVPDGYFLAELQESEIDFFIASLREWYPDIVVGSESRFLDPQFYRRQLFDATARRDGRSIWPILYRQSMTNDLAGCIFLEKNEAALTVTSPMAAIALNHRRTGTGLSFLGPTLLALVGKLIGAELAFYISSLRSKGNQVLAENTGYKLVGIIPANDRDQISPGVSLRVFEAVYAQVLVPMTELNIPAKDRLTPTTQAFWSFLFPEYPLA